MKTLTLKNARRLEQMIQARVAELSNINAASVAGRAISVYENVETILDTTAQTALSATGKLFELITLRYDIRARIAAVNESAGLNRNMVAEQMVKDKTAALQAINVHAVMTADQRSVTIQRFNTQKSNLLTGLPTATAYGAASDELRVGGLNTDDTKASIKTLLQGLSAERTRIADECSRINLSATIVLSDTDVELLTAFDITI